MGEYHKSVNFVVEIFSYSMLCTKVKRTKLKCMHININVHGKGSFVQKFITQKVYNLWYIHSTLCMDPVQKKKRPE